MAHPRIAVFARLAKDNAAPVRAIEGQATRLSRTMHGIAVDPLHHEIVVPNPFAEAILFFRDTAQGEEPPLRVIQGPSTYLQNPDSLALDPEHNEVFVPAQEAVLVFPREGHGNVAPSRVLRGPKTKLTRPYRIAVDPKNNVLVVANRAEPRGLLIFNRTDQGDVEPKAVIAGPKTGIMEPHAVQVYPERRLIFVALADVNSRYQEGRPRPEFIGVGIWNYTDNGDVPPKAIIRGPAGTLGRPRGLALSPEHKEIYVADMKRNSLFTYFLPEIF